MVVYWVVRLVESLADDLVVQKDLHQAVMKVEK